VQVAYGPPTWDDPWHATLQGRDCAPGSTGCRSHTIRAYNPLGIAFQFMDDKLWDFYIFRPGSAPSKPAR